MLVGLLPFVSGLTEWQGYFREEPCYFYMFLSALNIASTPFIVLDWRISFQTHLLQTLFA